MRIRFFNKFFPSFLSRENTDLMLPFDEVSDAMDKLRNEISYFFEKKQIDKKPRVLGLTSTEYNEGAFQTAVELAKSYSRMSIRVLLLDMDFHKALSTRFLTSKKYKGQLTPYEENGMLYRSSEGFDLYTCRTQKSDVTAKLERMHHEAFIAEKASGYDVVICSLPPVLNYADAGLISRDLDGIVYTVRENYTRQESILAALNYSEMIRNKIIGFMYYKTK